MTGVLQRLVGRATGELSAGLRPRLPSRFESGIRETGFQEIHAEEPAPRAAAPPAQPDPDTRRATPPPAIPPPHPNPARRETPAPPGHRSPPPAPTPAPAP